MFNIGTTRLAFTIGIMRAGLNALKDLYKNCGLRFAWQSPAIDGMLHDKVNRNDREAVQGVTLLFSAGTYIEQILFANLSLTYIDGVTFLPVVSSFDVDGRFLIPANGIAGLETIYNLETYTVDLVNLDDIILTFIGSDQTEILATQFLQPVIPTDINYTVVSQVDAYGGVKALDVGYFRDEALTIPVTIGTWMNVFPNTNKLVTYINELGVGIHPITENYGSLKVNGVITDISGTPILNGQPTTDVYIKLAQKYNDIFINDTSDILTLNGVNKILPIADMFNIDLQQFFMNIDKTEWLFTKESITRHSACDSKIRKYLELNEPYYVQTTPTSGVYEPYFVDGEQFNVLKATVEVNK